MARKYEAGTWEGEPHWRWVKMYKGIRYRVSCADLCLPQEQWTKEGSYQDANKWWREKKLELDNAAAAAHPHADALADLQRKLSYANRHGLHEEAAALTGQAEEVRTLPPDQPAVMLDDQTARRLEAARLLGVVIPSDLDPHALTMLFGDGRLWAERLKRQPSVPADKTIGGLADRWGADRIEEARRGTRNVEAANGLRLMLGHFTTWAGHSSPAESINADFWDRWYTHCSSRVAERDKDDKAGWSVTYAAKVFGTARSFIQWLWERELLPSVPRNLTSKKHRFERPQKAIVTYTNEEIHRLLDEARGQHRLHLLLMLNCGMTQIDISDLRKDQVNLEAATITRRRSKTLKKKNTPVVCYPLWNETVRLLREYLSDDPVYALLTEKSNRRWVRKELNEQGRLVKSDNIQVLFHKLRVRTGMDGEGKKSLKVFRKTSATRLKSNKDYRDLRFYFLGHSDHTVADRHYAAESQSLMDEAVAWLGQQYGLALK